MRLSVHRKNEERKKAASKRLMISIPLDSVLLHTTQGTRDGMFLKACLLILLSMINFYRGLF